VFVLDRGDVRIAVNFGDQPASLPAPAEILFTSPTPATSDKDGLTLPRHAGALMRIRPA
jgi:hypothetical protein